MATVVQDALKARYITLFKTLNVGYAADSVNDLIPTKYELALFASNPAAGGVYYYQHNVTKFLGSINEGISSAVSEAKYVHAQCPHALLILAGFSQGAMVMHQAELQLAAAHATGVLRQIAGTLLLADGDRVSNTAAREFGTSSAKSEGVQTWVQSFLGNGGQDVVDPATTANICNTGDIVCATSLKVLTETLADGSGVRVHTSYVKVDSNGNYTYTDPGLLGAASWIAGLTVSRLPGPDWRAIQAPQPPDATNSGALLYSVTCPSATACVALGRYSAPTSVQPFVVTGSGTSWTAASLPLGAYGSSTVNIGPPACPSVGSCVFAGTVSGSSGPVQGVPGDWLGHLMDGHPVSGASRRCCQSRCQSRLSGVRFCDVLRYQWSVHQLLRL
jgi:hypothetical protein